MKTNATHGANRLIISENFRACFRTAFMQLPITLVFLVTYNLNAQTVTAYPSLTFNSPTLISGNSLQLNAVYNFPNVMAGVDAHVTIVGMSGGAYLSQIDNTTAAGYYDAFQPFVYAGANDTSYIDWKFVFKKAGTQIDTILPLLAITGVDVDGDGSALKEFIQAATPGSFALDPGTYLSFGFDGVRSTATSTTANYPNIDTMNRPSMFQMNFANINTILYRNGAITTAGGQERQTCIYFKSFFETATLLPVKLLSFTVRPSGGETLVNWSATGEEDLKYYTVQKSTDGKKWTDIVKLYPGKRDAVNYYSVTDPGKNNSTVFYRLQQTNNDESAVYSKTIRLVIATPGTEITHTSAVNNTITLRMNNKTSSDYVFTVYNLNGVKITEVQNKFYTGVNQYSFDLPGTSGKGIYVLVIKNRSGQLIYNTKITSI